MNREEYIRQKLEENERPTRSWGSLAGNLLKKAGLFVGNIVLWSVAQEAFGGLFAGIGKRVVGALSEHGSEAIKAAINAAKAATTAASTVATDAAAAAATTAEVSTAKAAAAAAAKGAAERTIKNPIFSLIEGAIAGGKYAEQPSFLSFVESYIGKDTGFIGRAYGKINNFIKYFTVNKPAESSFKGYYESLKRVWGQGKFFGVEKGNLKGVIPYLGAGAVYGTARWIPPSVSWYAASRFTAPEEYKDKPLFNPLSTVSDFTKYTLSNAMFFGAGGVITKGIGSSIRGAFRSLSSVNVPQGIVNKIVAGSDFLLTTLYYGMSIMDKVRSKMQNIISDNGERTQSFIRNIYNLYNSNQVAPGGKIKDVLGYIKRKSSELLKEFNVSRASKIMNGWIGVLRDETEKFRLMSKYDPYSKMFTQALNTIVDQFQGVGGAEGQKVQAEMALLDRTINSFTKHRVPNFLSKIATSSKFGVERAEILLEGTSLSKANIEKMTNNLKEIMQKKREIVLKYLSEKNIADIFPYMTESNNKLFNVALAAPGELVERTLRAMTNVGFYIPFTHHKIQPLAFLGPQYIVERNPPIHFMDSGILGTRTQINRGEELGMYIGGKAYLINKSALTNYISKLEEIKEAKMLTPDKVKEVEESLFNSEKAIMKNIDPDLTFKSFQRSSTIARIYNRLAKRDYYDRLPLQTTFKALGIDKEGEYGKGFFGKAMRFMYKTMAALEVGPFSDPSSSASDLLEMSTSVRSPIGFFLNIFKGEAFNNMIEGIDDILSQVGKSPQRVLKVTTKWYNMLLNYMQDSFSSLARHKSYVYNQLKKFLDGYNVSIEQFANPREAAKYVLSLAASENSTTSVPRNIEQLARTVLESEVPTALKEPKHIQDIIETAAYIYKAQERITLKNAKSDLYRELERMGNTLGIKGLAHLGDAMNISFQYQKVLKDIYEARRKGDIDIENLFSTSTVQTLVSTLFGNEGRGSPKLQVLQQIYESAPRIRRFFYAEPYGPLLHNDLAGIWTRAGEDMFSTSPYTWIPVRGNGTFKDFFTSVARKSTHTMDPAGALSKGSSPSDVDKNAAIYLQDIIPRFLFERFNSVGSSMGLSLDTTNPQYRSLLDLAIKGIFMKRVLPIAGAIVGWNILDTFFDTCPLFDRTPLGQGLNVFLGSTFANVNKFTAKARDILGVTDFASYMEGLFPGIINSPFSKIFRFTTFPFVGAALGMRYGPTGAMTGAIIGATLGTYTAVSDMTKSVRDLEDEYEGYNLVPYKSNAGWILSKGNILGDRIYGFGPSWYARLRSQWKYTANVYGNKLESLIFKPWPALGFNPIGTLVDPFHYERKHYYTRPYPLATPAFEDIPIAGPLVAASAGKFLKPSLLMHKDQLAESFKEPFWPDLYFRNVEGLTQDITGFTGIFAPEHEKIGPFGGDIMNKFQNYSEGIHMFPDETGGRIGIPNIPQVGISTVFSESWYRMITEPMGIYGFLTSMKNVPGEAMARLAQTNLYQSTRRAFWEGSIGSFGLFTEYLRRYFPNFTNINMNLNPIRNRMPEWISSGKSFVDLRFGDPYSKVPAMGELFLPGPAYESWRHPLNTFPAYASYLDNELETITAKMLGIYYPTNAEILSERMETPYKQLVLDELERRNLLIQREAELYDPFTDIEGTADGVVRYLGKKMLINIEALPSDELYPSTLINRFSSKVNFMMKQMGLDTSIVIGIDVNDPTRSIAVPVHYNRAKYQEDITKLMTARAIATKSLEQGFVKSTYGAGYSHLDRLRVLGNVFPLVYSPEYKKELNIVKQQIALGILPDSVQDEVDEIQFNRNMIIQGQEFYTHRFLHQITSPSSKVTQMNLNKNIKAASEYSDIERILGAAYEALQNVEIPFFTRKFFNYRSPLEAYEQDIVYGSANSYWNNPVNSFIGPAVRSFYRRDDIISSSLASATFFGTMLGPTFIGVGATLGAIGSAVKNVAGAFGKYFIPPSIERMRDINQTFDNLEYIRAKQAYDDTNMRTFAEQANETVRGQLANLSSMTVASAMKAVYKPEQKYFLGMYQTEDIEERKKMLGILPPDVGAMLSNLWNMDKNTNRNTTFVRKRFNYGPNSNIWADNSYSGVGLEDNLDDIKYDVMKREGLDYHLVGLGWQDQIVRKQVYDRLNYSAVLESKKIDKFASVNINSSNLSSAVASVFNRFGIQVFVTVMDQAGPDDIYIDIEV